MGLEGQHRLDELGAEVEEVDGQLELFVVFPDGVGAEAAADVELDDLDDLFGHQVSSPVSWSTVSGS